MLSASRELWRHGLVVAQTGFATALVVMAALLLQDSGAAEHVPLGFGFQRRDDGTPKI